MSKKGSIAHYFHEGTRSEYLAQYIFSAFGTSVPVPHPEDSGIDLICSTGEIVDKNLFMYNHYYVQIKSQKENIKYDSENTIKWLKNLKYPLLICYINKKQNEIEIYQTLDLSLCSFRRDLISVELKFDNNTEHKKSDGLKDVVIYLDIPICKFNFNEIADFDFRLKMKKIISYWITLDQNNIDDRQIGFTCPNVPEKYSMNEVPGIATLVHCNYNDLVDTDRINYIDKLAKSLALSLFEVSDKNDLDLFMKHEKIISDLLSNLKLKDCWGLRMLQAFDEMISKHKFQLPGSLRLFKE